MPHAHSLPPPRTVEVRGKVGVRDRVRLRLMLTLFLLHAPWKFEESAGVRDRVFKDVLTLRVKTRLPGQILENGPGYLVLHKVGPGYLDSQNCGPGYLGNET